MLHDRLRRRRAALAASTPLAINRVAPTTCCRCCAATGGFKARRTQPINATSGNASPEPSWAGGPLTTSCHCHPRPLTIKRTWVPPALRQQSPAYFATQSCPPGSRGDIPSRTQVSLTRPPVARQLQCHDSCLSCKWPTNLEAERATSPRLRITPRIRIAPFMHGVLNLRVEHANQVLHACLPAHEDFADQECSPPHQRGPRR